MSRVGAQAQPIRDPGPTDNVALPVRAPTRPAAPFPHRASGDRPTIPAVVATYLPVWLADLTALGNQAGTTFTTAPLKRFGLG